MMHWHQNGAKEQIISDFFYFTLSGTKTHIKTCKTWINWRKPAADKPSCVPMYSHPLLQQHHKQGPLKKNNNNFVQIPAVLFTNLTSSEGWKTAGPKLTKLSPHPHPSQTSPKNCMGRALLLVPTSVHPIHFCTLCCLYFKAGLPHLCMWTSSFTAYAGRKNSSLWYLLSKSDWVQCTMHIKHFIWYFGR